MTMTDDMKTKNPKDALHIAVIPDGNRAYSRERGMESWEGYWHGESKIEELLDYINKNYSQIRTISIYALSNENLLKRPIRELKELFKLFTFAFKKVIRLKESKTRVRVIGRRDGLDPKFIKLINSVMDDTKYYTEKTLNVLLNFGEENSIGKDVDLLIRCGKPVQYRTSGFAPHDIRYAELYFLDGVNWGDFSMKNFDDAMKFYYEQIRKFGK